MQICLNNNSSNNNSNSESISFRVKQMTSIYFCTNIRHPQRPHISNVHLKIDNAHVFRGSTVNPGARIGHHSDIPSPLGWGCERCDWSTALGRCLLWNRMERNAFFNTFFFFLPILKWNYCYDNGNVLKTICSIGMQSFVAIYWLLMTLAMLKVWKAPAYVQTRFIPISFLMRNGTFKWIQLKSYRRYPYDSFFPS